MIDLSLPALNRLFVNAVTLALTLIAYGILAAAAPDSVGFGSMAVLCVLLIGWFPVVVAHEIGHALFAWAAGWRVWMISAVPFCVRLFPRISMRITSRVRQDVGGFALSTPLRAERDTTLRSVTVSAGGPVFNLLIGVGIAIPILGTVQTQPSANDLGLIAASLGLAVLSLAAGFRSAWPMTTKKGISNDGARIAAFLRSKQRRGGLILIHTRSLWC